MFSLFSTSMNFLEKTISMMHLTTSQLILRYLTYWTLKCFGKLMLLWHLCHFKNDYVSVDICDWVVDISKADKQKPERNDKVVHFCLLGVVSRIDLHCLFFQKERLKYKGFIEMCLFLLLKMYLYLIYFIVIFLFFSDRTILSLST